MGFDLWDNEPWFRTWRYGFIPLWSWPVHWKGWFSAALFLLWFPIAGLLLGKFGGNGPDSLIWIVILVPILFYWALCMQHTETVNLRRKPRPSHDNAFPGGRQ